MKTIDFKKWGEAIKEPTWYLRLVPEFKKLATLRESDVDLYETTKEKVYDFFEEHLLKSTVALGSSGRNWDIERKPIDTAIIHHTSNPSGLRNSRLSAIELVRLYAPYYASPTEKEVVGQPIWSNHLRNGTQVFYPYHWMIRTDGTTERLLMDEETGWHAGKWEINCRSIGICFDGDYENNKPSNAMLSAAASIIKSYNSVSKDRIFGHCEIKPSTTCPSTLFLTSSDQKGWKEDLLKLL